MIKITHIRMVGGHGHEHVSDLRWRNPENGRSGESSRAEMVSFINGGGQAWASDARGRDAVGVVNATPPYVRTHADGRWTDNLLALPRF